MNEIVYSKRMKLMIENLGITQKDFSEMTGINEAAICRYLQGTRIPNAGTLIAIARATNVSIDWLLGHGSDEKMERM